MRVALAAVLFSAPDLLLLDEPTNYLDLEGALWLVDYLSRCPATIVVIMTLAASSVRLIARPRSRWRAHAPDVRPAHAPRACTRIPRSILVPMAIPWLQADSPLPPTSCALDEPSEAALYRLLADKLPDSTIVSIGHRSTLEAFHQRKAELRRADDHYALPGSAEGAKS